MPRNVHHHRLLSVKFLLTGKLSSFLLYRYMYVLYINYFWLCQEAIAKLTTYYKKNWKSEMRDSERRLCAHLRITHNSIFNRAFAGRRIRWDAGNYGFTIEAQSMI